MKPCLYLSCSDYVSSTVSRQVDRTSCQIPVAVYYVDCKGENIEILVARSSRTFILMMVYLLLFLGDQMLWKQGTHMEGCSSEGILFYAGFHVVHTAVPVSKCEVGHIDETPSDKSCIVCIIACVMLQLKVIR